MSNRRPPSTRARPEAEPTSFDAAGRPVLRCAIYTRQSVSRGEQDLTSCDVQRERCEDYVRAMQYEGWVALDERFDDLGVSGGSLERPALRRLLSWCVQGRVDVVVVTSLDRLARKMSDWVRLNDWLKQASVELVILQGAGGARGPLAELVNNVVASLAEFERDIISERLREAKGRARASRWSRSDARHGRRRWPTWPRRAARRRAPREGLRARRGATWSDARRRQPAG